MKRITCFFAAALAMLAVACQKPEVEDSLSIETSSIVVSNEGVTQNIVFSSNADWTVESDQDFITFDRTSGAAGNNLTVVMTVAPNTAYTTRTAKVTVKAGSKSSVINVEQKEVTTFSSAMVYNIDSKAQDIEIKVEGNVSYTVTVDGDSPWITVTQTKAEPVSGVIKLHVSANSQLGPRTGHFTVATDAASQTYEVVQAADWTPAASATASYVGLRDYFYDDGYQTSPQTIVELVTEDGVKVCVVINLGEEEVDPTVLPTGTFVPDQSLERVAGTFALKGGNGQFFTYIQDGDRVIDVADGEVSIAADGSNVVITAALVDNALNTLSYSYEGELAVEDDSFEILVMSGYYAPSFYSTTDTYFTTKANCWHLTIWPTAAPSADASPLSFVNFKIYGEAGEVDSSSLPTGTFKYVANIPTDDSVSYNNGKLNAQPGTFTDFSANDIPQSYSRIKEGTEAILTIEKNADGTYKIAFTATLEEYEHVVDEGGNWVYDEDWNPVLNVLREYQYSIEDDSVVIPYVSEGGRPYPDEDVELVSSTFPSYNGLYFGPALGEGFNAFIIQFNYLNGIYNINLVVTVAEEDWVFEENMGRTNYCGTPLPEGTYTFSNTIGDKKIVPGKFVGQPYCTVTNLWTGSIGAISGGSIDVSDNQITFNLDVTVGEKTIKVTGSPALAVQAIRNYASYASRLTL